MQTMTTVRTTRTPRARAVRLLTVALAAVLIGLSSFVLVRAMTTPRRTTPFYNPPVLAGQWIPGYCSAGVYARHGDTIVLTSSPHCAGAGVVAHDPDTGILEGTFGPTAQDASCPYPGHTCAASDMNYLIVAPARIPWGHLNVIDLGTAGYRVLAPGTQPLGCDDVAIGDPLELDGRGIYRTGSVAEKDPYLHPPDEDGSYFPCMMASTAQVGPGDSGSVVLVRGIPAGVTSRTFGGDLGFTPMAEGLAELDLMLCTTPDCGLTPQR